MKKEFFRKLADNENGKFYFQDEDIAIGGGVRSPNVIFKVVFENNSKIEMSFPIKETKTIKIRLL